MPKKKHTIVIDFNDKSSVATIALMLAEFLFVPYTKGKKYDNIDEINAKIPLLERLFGDDYIYIINAYLQDILNPNIRGLIELLQNITQELENKHGTKFEIEFNINKLK